FSHLPETEFGSFLSPTDGPQRYPSGAPFPRRSWSPDPMAKVKLEARSKKALAEMARKKGISGWRTKTKEELVQALVPGSPKRSRKPSAARKRLKSRVAEPRRKAVRVRPQVAAARDTSNGSSGEEQVERSKFEVGVPTKNL